MPGLLDGELTENHAAAVSFYFMYYNFCRVYQSLTNGRNEADYTPAMAAGVADRIWQVEDILARMDPKVPLRPNGPITCYGRRSTQPARSGIFRS